MRLLGRTALILGCEVGVNLTTRSKKALQGTVVKGALIGNVGCCALQYLLVHLHDACMPARPAVVQHLSLCNTHQWHTASVLVRGAMLMLDLVCCSTCVRALARRAAAQRIPAVAHAHGALCILVLYQGFSFTSFKAPADGGDDVQGRGALVCRLVLGRQRLQLQHAGDDLWGTQGSRAVVPGARWGRRLDYRTEVTLAGGAVP